ncbi:hypothetical protein [Plantactinospora sp. WMMB782]|uniref:hypothetical protein n=1 Tax=Plantactinospora sp. WMMB782 TaxID=3404121 RepID=UPI003B9469BE
MTSVLPVDLIDIMRGVISSAYSHLAEVVEHPAGSGRMKAPRNVPAILWRPNRDVPILSASRVWARIAVTVVAFHHDGYFAPELPDLWLPERGTRIHPGYTDERYDDLVIRCRQHRPVKYAREFGLYRTDQVWQTSIRLTSDDGN